MKNQNVIVWNCTKKHIPVKAYSSLRDVGDYQRYYTACGRISRSQHENDEFGIEQTSIENRELCTSCVEMSTVKA